MTCLSLLLPFKSVERASVCVFLILAPRIPLDINESLSQSGPISFSTGLRLLGFQFLI